MVNALPRRRSNLHKHHRTRLVLGELIKQLPERLQPLRDALGVIQTINPQQHSLRVAQTLPQHLHCPGLAGLLRTGSHRAVID